MEVTYRVRKETNLVVELVLKTIFKPNYCLKQQTINFENGTHFSLVGQYETNKKNQKNYIFFQFLIKTSQNFIKSSTVCAFELHFGNKKKDLFR